MSIIIKNLNFTYMPKTPYEKHALKDINLTINEGEIVGIIGSTGSGKSTLIQHLNALIKLSSGQIIVNDIDLTQKKPDLKKLRKTFGMLFQYPEYQLFDETVEKDVAFAPLNFGFSKDEANKLSKAAIEMVGLNFDEVKEKSPFDLSGGQKRRAAIAGIIAYEPEILILDEPTAGLDPRGKKEILDLLIGLKEKSKIKTIIMISHNMDEIAHYCTRIVAMCGGRIVSDTTPSELFTGNFDINAIGLDYPTTVKIAKKLRQKGFMVRPDCLTTEALTYEINKLLEGRNG